MPQAVGNVATSTAGDGRLSKVSGGPVKKKVTKKEPVLLAKTSALPSLRVKDTNIRVPSFTTKPRPPKLKTISFESKQSPSVSEERCSDEQEVGAVGEEVQPRILPGRFTPRGIAPRHGKPDRTSVGTLSAEGKKFESENSRGIRSRTVTVLLGRQTPTRLPGRRLKATAESSSSSLTQRGPVPPRSKTPKAYRHLGRRTLSYHSLLGRYQSGSSTLSNADRRSERLSQRRLTLSLLRLSSSSEEGAMGESPPETGGETERTREESSVEKKEPNEKKALLLESEEPQESAEYQWGDTEPETLEEKAVDRSSQKTGALELDESEPKATKSAEAVTEKKEEQEKPPIPVTEDAEEEIVSVIVPVGCTLNQNPGVAIQNRFNHGDPYWLEELRLQDYGAFLDIMNAAYEEEIGKERAWLASRNQPVIGRTTTDVCEKTAKDMQLNDLVVPTYITERITFMSVEGDEAPPLCCGAKRVPYGQYLRSRMGQERKILQKERCCSERRKSGHRGISRWCC